MANKCYTPYCLIQKIFILVILLNQANSQFDNITYIEDALLKGAVCLDGSPGSYYFVKGYGEQVNNWMVYLQGGGWCESKEVCFNRSQTQLGSSKYLKPFSVDGIFSLDPGTNPDFYNWNKVYINYCDGASFMADVEAVDPTSNLHLRGARIFKAAIEELLAKGMLNASNAILSGNSAGGLATILNCDRFGAYFRDVVRVKCITDSGFFIRAKNLPSANDREHYFAQIVDFHELAKNLPTTCTSRMIPELCIFAEYLVGNIQTPLFLLNSVFDKYQIQYLLHSNLDPIWRNCTVTTTNCNHAQLQLIQDFGYTFVETVTNVSEIRSRGLFINSCYIHDFIYRKGNWLTTPMIQNMTISKAIGDWYFNDKYTRLIEFNNDFPVNCNTEIIN